MKTIINKGILIRTAAVVLSCLMLAGCGNDSGKQTQEASRKIAVMTVGPVTHNDKLIVSGNITPTETVQLSFKLSGTIANIYPKEGELVKSGQKIANLDPSDYTIQTNAALADQSMAQAGISASQAQYKAAKAEYDAAKIQADTEIASKTVQAKAQLDLTQATYNRIKTLVAAEAASQSQLDEITAKLKVDMETYQQALDAKTVADVNLAAAQRKVEAYESQIHSSAAQAEKADAAVNKAKNDLTDTTIFSPFDGVILKKIVNERETVSAGYPVVSIGNTKKVYVEIGVSDKYINSLKKDQSAKITAYGTDGEFDGRIAEIGSLADANTRSFPVKILIDNSKRTLKSGMIARAALQIGEANITLIPLDSVLQLSDGSSVYIYDKATGTAKKRAVTTGEVIGDLVQVSNGLISGDQLIINGQFLLHDGDAVQLAEEDVQ